MSELILTNDHRYLLDGKPIDSLTSTIAEAGLIRESDEWYLERGSAIHLATEFYDKRTLDMDSVDPQIQGYLASWKRFRKDQNYIPTDIEYKTYHPILMVGTTIDRLPGPLDIKGGVPTPWHILQVAFQWDCLKTNGWAGMKIIPMDVYLDKDGDPPKVKSYTSSEMREAFKVYCSMLVFLRWRRSVGIK